MRTEAEGLAVAKGLEAQQIAIGKDQTALVNVVKSLAVGAQRFMPENLAITVGSDGSGLGLNALTPLLMRFLQTAHGASAPHSDGAAVASQAISRQAALPGAPDREEPPDGDSKTE